MSVCVCVHQLVLAGDFLAAGEGDAVAGKRIIVDGVVQVEDYVRHLRLSSHSNEKAAQQRRQRVKG